MYKDIPHKLFFPPHAVQLRGSILRLLEKSEAVSFNMRQGIFYFWKKKKKKKFRELSSLVCPEQKFTMPTSVSMREVSASGNCLRCCDLTYTPNQK